MNLPILAGDAFRVRVRGLGATGERGPDSPDSVRVEVPFGPADIVADGCVGTEDFIALSQDFAECAPSRAP